MRKELPDSKIRTGMKMNRIMCGLNFSRMSVEWPRTPRDFL